MGVLAFVLVSATIVADVAVADARVALPFSDQFVGVNPCTGLSQTGTVTGTLYLQENQGATVVTVDRNITTTAGYEGSGRSTLVVNSEIQKFSLQDMITNESGSRIRLDYILVIDLASGTVTTVHGALACVSQ
jgi:hypothetical protein